MTVALDLASQFADGVINTARLREKLNTHSRETLLEIIYVMEGTKTLQRVQQLQLDYTSLRNFAQAVIVDSIKEDQ